MKAFRRILKLLPPAFLMRRWLDRRYGIKVPPAPGGVVAGFVLAILPYAFTAALSVRVESDCRLLKYFLPYGKMKGFVKLAYNMQVGNDEKDCGLAGKFRALMPYGLVLWWDAEDRRLVDPSKQPQKPLCQQPQKTLRPSVNLSVKERQVLEHQDRIEALTLRMLIKATGGVDK